MNRFGHAHDADHADQLNAELDRMITGGRPDGEFARTAARLYSLAADAGMTSPGASAKSSHTHAKRRRIGPMPIAFLTRKHWRAAMSLSSTAAVFAVVLTMVFGGMPSFSGINRDDRTQLAAQDTTPSCESTLEGNCTSTPPARPDNSDIVMANAPAVLTAGDCTVEPRTREDMLDVLGTLPQNQTLPILDIDTNSTPPTSDDFHDGAVAGAALTQDAYDGAQESYLQWQTCTKYFLTWQWAAVESDEILRQHAYLSAGNGPFNYLNTTTPYSDDTLNEILDGWEASEAASREHLAQGNLLDADRTWVMDPNSASFSADGTRLWANANDYIGGVAAAELYPGDPLLVRMAVSMVLEDGIWRLDSIGPCCG